MLVTGSPVYVNSQQYEAVVVEEQVSWSFQQYISRDLYEAIMLLNDMSTFNGDMKLEITRNLKDDSFNLKPTWHAHSDNKRENYVLSQKQIDSRITKANNITFGKNDKYFTSFTVDNTYFGTSQGGHDYAHDKGFDFIHSSLYNSKPLRKVSLIGVNWHIGDDSPSAEDGRNLIVMNLLASPTFYDLPTNVSIGPGQALVVKTPKSFEVITGLGLHHEMDSVGKAPTILTTSYNYYILVADRLDQFNPTLEVAKIYFLQDKESPIGSDLYNGSVEYRASTFSGTLGSTFVPNPKIHQIDRLNSLEWINKVGFESNYVIDQDKDYAVTEEHNYAGSVMLTESAAYDYKKQQIVKGTTSDSALGEQIPLNYSGPYWQKLKLSVNSIFREIEVTVNREIEQAVLNPFSGQVKLTLKQGSPNNKDLQLPNDWKERLSTYQISAEHAKWIREIYDNENFIDLVGLERLGISETLS